MAFRVLQKRDRSEFSHGMYELRVEPFLPLMSEDSFTLFRLLSAFSLAQSPLPARADVSTSPVHSVFTMSFTLVFPSSHMDCHVHFQCLNAVRLRSCLFARTTSMDSIIGG